MHVLCQYINSPAMPLPTVACCSGAARLVNQPSIWSRVRARANGYRATTTRTVLRTLEQH